MNLENFRQVYKSVITESQDDRKFVNYIKSIVEEVIAEKTVKNKSKNGIAEAHDGGPYVDSYGPGPLTMDAIGMVSGYDSLDDYNMPMIPMEYDLDKIEVTLKAAKDKMTEEEYKDFIYLDTDDDAVIQILFDYRNIKNLKQASKFLNFIKEN